MAKKKKIYHRLYSSTKEEKTNKKDDFFSPFLMGEHSATQRPDLKKTIFYEIWIFFNADFAGKKRENDDRFEIKYLTHTHNVSSFWQVVMI